MISAPTALCRSVGTASGGGRVWAPYAGTLRRNAAQAHAGQTNPRRRVSGGGFRFYFSWAVTRFTSTWVIFSRAWTGMYS